MIVLKRPVAVAILFQYETPLRYPLHLDMLLLCVVQSYVGVNSKLAVTDGTGKKT